MANHENTAAKRASKTIEAREISPITEFARAADLSVADAERVAKNPENHGVNVAKAAVLVEAISEQWGDLDTFRMCNGYETFE